MMVSKATKNLGTELSKKYSFRNRKQFSSNSKDETEETDETKVTRDTKKNKQSKRQHISGAFEKSLVVVPEVSSEVTEENVRLQVKSMLRNVNGSQRIGVKLLTIFVR